MTAGEKKTGHTKGAEYLLLKWGTLKGWDIGENQAAMAALRRYHDEPVSMGAMQQRDTDAQKQTLCELIDCIDGEIINDWSGEKMTKDAAKQYVREYRTPPSLPTPN